MSQPQFHTYFNPQDIIKLLCKYRLKYAKKKHKLHLLADISSSERTIRQFREKDNVPIELSKLLPSRRKWYKPRANERKKFSDSQRCTLFALQKTIYTEHLKSQDRNYNPPLWYKELCDFIERVQSRINHPGIKFQQPKLVPVKRDDYQNKKECRPLSLYSIEDRIIISITAKYFTEKFDKVFHDCAFAFRAVQKINGKKIVKSHHDCIEKIMEFRERFPKKNIYVAECDIKQFFDCVNHGLVKKIMLKLASTHNIELDAKSIVIFNEYLTSYAFSKNVYPQQKEFFEKNKLVGGKFKWSSEELKRQFYSSAKYNNQLSNISIGVPQGGAISCFISNLILHSVDEAVMKNSNGNYLYMRFCDDMVILYTNKQKCKQALSRYKMAMRKLKLLIHEPKEISQYSKAFWKTKSKSPYKWAATSLNKSNVPWLAFVGYQIKYDGSMRVRKKSFENEIQKQYEESDTILKSLNHFKHKDAINQVSKKSKRQQVYALENRLISMSVGRIKLYGKNQHQTLCWTNGFKALRPNKTAERQLRILDSNRAKNLNVLKKALIKLDIKSRDVDQDIKHTRYFGSPFSYSNFLLQKTKFSNDQ